MKLEIVFKDGRKEIFDNVMEFKVTDEQTSNEECHAFEVKQTFPKGKIFEVNPLEIDRSQFEKPRKDKKQEQTRQIIQKAFAEVDKHPQKYDSPFYTLIPEKNWNGYKTVDELRMYANYLGGQMADWVEQALEWAQKILYFKNWEKVCNHKENASCRRMTYWKDGLYQNVGGLESDVFDTSMTTVNDFKFTSASKFYDTVPLVVFKKK